MRENVRKKEKNQDYIKKTRQIEYVTPCKKRNITILLHCKKINYTCEKNY